MTSIAIRTLAQRTLMHSALLLYSLSSAACTQAGDDAGGDGGGPPNTAHHSTDSVTDNGNGTSTATVGGVAFTTSQRDFSSDPTVTDAMTVSATKVGQHAIGGDLDEFRVEGGKLYGLITESSFDNHAIVYDLSSDAVLSTRTSDFYASGFDYNGVIVMVDGAENLDFFQVEDDQIGTHFFQAKSFQGSKFLSSCYVDHDTLYVYDSDRIWRTPIHDTTAATKLVDVPSFSQVRFTSDEAYLYIAVSEFTGASVKKVDKSTQAVVETFDFAAGHITGVTVDANYLYVADTTAGVIRVVNKHTKVNSGDIALAGVDRIYFADGVLYAFNGESQSLEKYELTFAPASPGTNGPATEHHSTDSVTSNGNGTSTATVGGVSFTTDQRDFSAQPVVMDQKTVAATKEAEFAIGGDLEQFRVLGDTVYGLIKQSAFENHAIMYSLTSASVLSSRAPDFYATGFDFNGVLVMVDGAENIDFFKVDGNQIGAHFFQAKNFQGSKFLSSCYVDHDMLYVYDSDKIWRAPVHDTTSATKLIDVPSFSQVSFSSDERYLYVAVSEYSGATVLKIDETNFTLVETFDLGAGHVTGITVDANYLFVADETAGAIRVLNKHTKSDAGSISLSGVDRVYFEDGYLYAFNDTTQKLEKYSLVFQP